MTQGSTASTSFRHKTGNRLHERRRGRVKNAPRESGLMNMEVRQVMLGEGAQGGGGDSGQDDDAEIFYSF